MGNFVAAVKNLKFSLVLPSNYWSYSVPYFETIEFSPDENFPFFILKANRNSVNEIRNEDLVCGPLCSLRYETQTDYLVIRDFRVDRISREGNITLILGASGLNEAL